VESPFTDWVAALSPDGQWITYVSDESGTPEVYVKQVAGPVKHCVSVAGGVQPRWRRDGRELFFLDDNGQLMSAAIREGPTFATDRPQPLFQSCRVRRPIGRQRTASRRADVGQPHAGGPRSCAFSTRFSSRKKSILLAARALAIRTAPPRSTEAGSRRESIRF
jgi:hypothetical protein